MNTITNADGPRNIYWPSKYLGDTPMITPNQRAKLTALIYQNVFEDHERELRLSELEDLTQADADYELYKFSLGIWN